MSLVPPPCEELTTSDPSRRGDAGEAAGDDADIATGQNEGAQVDVAGCEVVVGKGWARGQGERGLRDVPLRVRDDPLTKEVDFGLSGGGADEHSVTAGAVDFFDHELGEVGEDVVLVLRPAQHPGVHIADDGRLPEIETNHVGDVGVDGFVIGNAGADGIGDGDVAAAVSGEESGDAEHGVRAKHQGIQEVVVDAAVNHIHALGALGGAHEYCFVADEEILSFHQLDAHLLSEKRMFEIGTVVGTRGQ